MLQVFHCDKHDLIKLVFCSCSFSAIRPKSQLKHVLNIGRAKTLTLFSTLLLFFLPIHHTAWNKLVSTGNKSDCQANFDKSSLNGDVCLSTGEVKSANCFCPHLYRGQKCWKEVGNASHGELSITQGKRES